jgi:hypothetical protein
LAAKEINNSKIPTHENSKSNLYFPVNRNRRTLDLYRLSVRVIKLKIIMPFITDIQARQLRQLKSTLSAVLDALAVLDEPKPKKPRKKKSDRFDEMYATGKWGKPDHLKKKKKSKL